MSHVNSLFKVAAAAFTATVVLHAAADAIAVEVHAAAVHDVSAPLGSLRPPEPPPESGAARGGAGRGARGGAPRANPGTPPVTVPPDIPAAGAAVEQHAQGTLPAAAMVAGFDGLGFGFTGPQGAGRGAALDNSLAVGPDDIVQVINGAGIAVYTKKGPKYDNTGTVLYGAVPSRTVFQGFAGPCASANFGDVVVRYDQLAGRWLFVMPIFQRIPDRPDEPYSVCYAVSKTSDPLGEYYRYEFRRKRFPDYPRPAVWPDGYYVPTSTGDTVVQKHDCIADRARMLNGEDASEQCLIIDGVNFLNNADVDGPTPPPAGAPNIMMAAGGTQLKGMSEHDDRFFQDDGIYYWKVHVDWKNPQNTNADGPRKISVAPYHYLCNGQLSNCVPQPGTETRLDSQGDKLMQRLVYRNFDDHQSIVAAHSVNSSPGKAGGVRWYEFRLDTRGDPVLAQQGTYAPDEAFRWMPSAAMDRLGDIGIGYSFGSAKDFVGQRFAARRAGDPPGQLSLHETVLAEGKGAQQRGNRWVDYASTAMDPSDDCTFWYVGDYFKEGAAALSTRIGGFRVPGCLQLTLRGSVFFDLNHDGKRDAGEPGIAGAGVSYAGPKSGSLTSDAGGNFAADIPGDAASEGVSYSLTLQPPARPGWALTRGALTPKITDAASASGLNLGAVCTVRNRGGEHPKFWASGKGRDILMEHDAAWRKLMNSTFHLNLPNKADQAYTLFKKWLAKPTVQTQLAALALNISFGEQDGHATLEDPVSHDWVSLSALVTRVSALSAAADPYKGVLGKLNANTQPVTPSNPAACGGY